MFRRGGRWTLGLVLLALIPALETARAGSTQSDLTVSGTPSLIPAFSPGIPDYVARCRNGRGVTLTFSPSSGTTVAVDGAPARAGAFTATVPLHSGQSLRFAVSARGARRTYRVRCLPADFPLWTFQRLGTPQAAYFVVDPCCHRRYAIIFDSNGVPVWWLHTRSNVLDASLLPDGDMSVGIDGGPRLSQGVSNAKFSEYRLDGHYVRTFSIPDGTPTDRHELQVLPNGDYIVVAHVARSGVNLRRFGGPAHATVFDGQIALVSPHHKLLWSWSSKGHIKLSETGHWFKALVLTHPARLALGRKGYDIVHINAVEPYRRGFLVSFRHLDAIYYIDKTTGNIIWKLGGTHTRKSLRIVGDDVPDFGGQHDVRALPDGTVTLFDNGTGRGRGPRALRLRINLRARTATLLEAVVGKQTPSSPCCGSARKLPGGDWVVSWGGTELVQELTPSDQPVVNLDFHLSTTYRAQPILAGQLSRRRLDNAMDVMHPRR